MAATEPLADQAARLLASGQVERAVELVVNAARRGDPDALNQMALWHVYGQPLIRDFGLARLLFGRAGEAGHARAAVTHAVFVALGAGADPDWPTALKLLERAAGADPTAERQLNLIHAMDIDGKGQPQNTAKPDRRSQSPDVLQFASFFTPDECAHVIALSTPLLVPSIIVDSRTGKPSPHPVRTSFDAVLGPIQQDMVVHALNMRIAAATHTTVDQGEPLVVLRYTPGQQYREHHDGLPGEANQRNRTAIAYLNTDYDSGETSFAAASLAIKGGLGDMLSFANTTADGGIDGRSRHAGRPVTRGEKWICTRWIRRGAFDPWGLRTLSPHLRAP